MIDIVTITTTATWNDKADLWIADVKGYPVTGRGETPEEAVMNARDELQKFFQTMTGRCYVSARHMPVSLKVEIEIRIETTRGTTLTEFGLGKGHDEPEGSE